ncbi:MAG: threonine-phosphate decarboxylase [Flavonifractor sp.]|nr:threonine-phosphate decarboxylase [Flavonifractor sp.]
MQTSPHGGDLQTAESTYGGKVLDFSANLNPLGMPEAVRRAAATSVAEAIHYPDPYCRELKKAIARHDQIPNTNWVICGSGAADIIFRLALVLGAEKALVTAPTFSEYETALAWSGCQILYHPLFPEQNFDLTDAILDDITDDLSVLFLCTPNNPTGRLIPHDLLLEILQRCRRTGTRLVLDECFLPLSDGAGLGMSRWMSEYLFLLRAFTKSYAVPGLRLGYGLTSDRHLQEALDQAGPPWSVSVPAQAAGIAAFQECPNWPEEARNFLAKERPRLTEALRALGLTVTEGQANYLLFRAEHITDLKERLLERGVLIRSCANYHGLGPDYYRVCVRLESDNQRLLAALQEVL